MATKQTKSSSPKKTSKRATPAKKSIKTTTTKSKSADAVSKPLVGTGRKIALAVYFTFVGTLMGVLALQIWWNGANIDNTPQYSNNNGTQTQQSNTTTPNNATGTQTTTDYNSESKNNDLSNYSNYYSNNGNTDTMKNLEELNKTELTNMKQAEQSNSTTVKDGQGDINGQSSKRTYDEYRQTTNIDL